MKMEEDNTKGLKETLCAIREEAFQFFVFSVIQVQRGKKTVCLNEMKY
jgi:hypothetical protein